MASGSFYITRNSGSTYLTFRVDWAAYSNGVSANTSDLDVYVYVLKSSSSTSGTWGTVNTSVTVDGTTTLYENGLSASVSPGGSCLLFAKRYPGINHLADGTRSVSISVNVSGNIMSASGSGVATFDQIPRQATIDEHSAPNFTDEENPSIIYSNPAGNAVSKLEICIAKVNGGIIVPYRDISKTGSSYTFNLTDEERVALRREALSGSNTVNVKFVLYTEIGGNPFWSNVTRTLTIINADPVLSPTVVDTGTNSTRLTGGDPNKIIKGHSYLEISTGATALKEASITKQSISCGDISIHAASGVMENVTSGTFTFTATDNRGNTSTKTVMKEIINYEKLTCVLEVGNPTVDGDLKFSIRGNYFDGTFGAVDNSLKVEYRIKESGAEWDDTWIDASMNNHAELGFNIVGGELIITDNAYATSIMISDLDYRTTYVIQARARDEVYTGYIITSEYAVKTAPVFDWGPDDFDFHVPVFREGNPMGYYPIGGIYTSSDNTDPGELFGGTWELERRFYGGELLAYGSAWNESACSMQAVNGTDYGFSDILPQGVYASHLCNYMPDILTASSGTIWLQTKGIVGLVEATVEISGANSGCNGLWFLRENKNALPSSVILTGGQGLIAVNGGYSGASTKYFYNVSDSDTGTNFYINPVWRPYGGNFNPGTSGTKSTLHVKAYAKGKVTYMWKRVA